MSEKFDKYYEQRYEGRHVSNDDKFVPKNGQFFTMLCGESPENGGAGLFQIDVCLDGDELFVAMPCGDSEHVVTKLGNKVRVLAASDYKGVLAAIIISTELGVMRGVAGTDGMKLSAIKFNRETNSWCSFWRK